MGNYRVPEAENEPIYSYAPGTPEREGLIKAIDELKKQSCDIPMIINGEEIRVGKPKKRSPLRIIIHWNWANGIRGDKRKSMMRLHRRLKRKRTGKICRFRSAPRYF